MQASTLTATRYLTGQTDNIRLCTIKKTAFVMTLQYSPPPPGAAAKPCALLPSMATCKQTYLQPGHNRGAVPGGEGQTLAAGFLQQVVSGESGSEFSTDLFCLDLCFGSQIRQL